MRKQESLYCCADVANNISTLKENGQLVFSAIIRFEIFQQHYLHMSVQWSCNLPFWVPCYHRIYVSCLYRHFLTFVVVYVRWSIHFEAFFCLQCVVFYSYLPNVDHSRSSSGTLANPNCKILLLWRWWKNKKCRISAQKCLWKNPPAKGFSHSTLSTL